MLQITNGNELEFLLEDNYEKIEQRNGEALQISFDSFNYEKNIGHRLLDSNVLLTDEDGHEYIVKQIEETNYGKRVLATHVYYELIGKRKYDTLSGNNDFNYFASWLFQGSGWFFINEDITESIAINDFGNDNLVKLTQTLINSFNCEMQILPHRQIRFAKIIGEDNDLQFRYKNNIESITRNIDTSNVRTRIRAIGKDGLTVDYVSPLASNPKFGILDAEPVIDGNIENNQELLELARKNLIDVPETNIDISVIGADGNVGDKVWLIHEGLGIEYQVRILSKNTKRPYEKSTLEIGNVPKRTIEDVLISQKEEVKQNKEEAEKAVSDLDEKTTAQTEEIRLFVENVEQTLYSEITLTATQIRSEVRNIESNLNSTITQTANQINLRVNDNDLRIGELDIRADRIQSNVTNLENSTNSSITQLSNNINLKVDVGGTISDINLSQGVATINADKINLNGAVIVNGSISGSTNITVQNSAAVGNALYFGGFRGSVDFIEISGGDMTFNSFGDFMFSGGDLYVNGRKVVTE